MKKHKIILKRTKSVNAILKYGKALFWKYGIRKVTVEDICKEAGVSKMTFYRSFENKYELAKIILIEFANESYMIFSELFSREDPFPEIVAEFLEIKKQQAKAVSIEFIKDIYVQNEFTDSLKRLLEESQKSLMTTIYKSFDKAREEGWIKKEVSTSFIMYMFEKVGAMAEDEHLISMFKDSEEMASTMTSFLFNGILNEKPI